MGLIPLSKDDFISRLKGLVILRGWTKMVSDVRLATTYQAHKLHQYIKEDLDIALELIKTQDYFDERQLVSAMVDSKNSRMGDSDKVEWAKLHEERRREQKPDRKECIGDHQCDKCDRDLCHLISRDGLLIINVMARSGAFAMPKFYRDGNREQWDMTREIAQFHEKYPGLKRMEG